MQAPAMHVSVCVQASRSLHAVVSGAFGFEHVPLAGLHVPTPWHWSSAVHVTGLAPAQTPAVHESVCVHALPLLQLVPSTTGGLLHTPVPGLQVPAAWH